MYGWWANLSTKEKWQFFEIIPILSALFSALKPHLSIDDRPSQLRLHWKIFYWVVQSKRNTNTAGIFSFFFMHYGWWANLYTKDKWQFFEIILILSAIFFALKPHLSIDDRPSQLRLHWKIFYWVVQSKRNTNTAGIFYFFFIHYHLLTTYFISWLKYYSFHFILSSIVSYWVQAYIIESLDSFEIQKWMLNYD